MSYSSVESLTALIRANYARILERVDRAVVKSGRQGEGVKVVVVSKAQPLHVIESAVEAGIHIFGENYPEETAPKIQVLNNPNLEWHMIGHLQSRKVKIVAEDFDWFHALDSLRLAERLNRALVEVKRRMPVLLEMNVGGEQSKSGFLANNESEWSQLADIAAQIQNYPNIDLCGLMTMPPLELESEKSRDYFSKLRRLRDFIQSRYPQLNLEHLSMGTSQDFESAIIEGATMVRVGQAILGARVKR